MNSNVGTASLVGVLILTYLGLQSLKSRIPCDNQNVLWNLVHTWNHANVAHLMANVVGVAVGLMDGIELLTVLQKK